MQCEMNKSSIVKPNRVTITLSNYTVDIIRPPIRIDYIGYNIKEDNNFIK